jgi:hypothetical protein
VGVAVIGWFAFPKYRPEFAKKTLRDLSGYTPAKTPSEAVEKFRDCIRKRDYDTAVLYTGGPYKEYLLMGAEPAAKLAASVDDLAYNVNDMAKINSPDGKYVLDRMQPFPKDFKFSIHEPPTDQEFKTLYALFPADFPIDSIKTLSGKVAIGQISFDLMQPGENKAGRMNFSQFEGKIFLCLVPNPGEWTKVLGLVGLKEEGNDKDKGWKIYFPMWDDTRQKVDYLKQNYGNYCRALDNVSSSLKHDASTKADFETELSKQLNDAK